MSEKYKSSPTHVPPLADSLPDLFDVAQSYEGVQSLRPGKDLRVLSLFSGAGGMDLGLEGDFLCHSRSISPESPWRTTNEASPWVHLAPTRFQTIFANDILEGARRAWLQYMQRYEVDESVYHLESIVDLVKRHRSGEHVFPTDIDLVVGGFPCQDFSIAGKRRGFASEKGHDGQKHLSGDLPSIETRGMLYYWMKEVIEIVRPKVFIAENVKGLVNLDDVKEVIRRDFASAEDGGYLVLAPRVLHAGRYGVPQSRERVFFIGLRRADISPELLPLLEREELPREYDPYPQPTHSAKPEDIQRGFLPQVTCAEVFAGLPEPEFSDDLSQRYFSKAKYMGAHCQGQTEVNLAGLGPTIRSEHHGNIEYRRLSAEHGGRHTEELEQGLPERRLTPRECALIQTFPPDYPFVSPSSTPRERFSVSSSMAYKVIGNAVPPLLAYHLAQRLQQLWPIYFPDKEDGGEHHHH